jgi:hypothetical protein
MECIKWLMGEECKILGYDLTSINKGVISGIRIRSSFQNLEDQAESGGLSDSERKRLYELKGKQ